MIWFGNDVGGGPVVAPRVVGDQTGMALLEVMI